MLRLSGSIRVVLWLRIQVHEHSIGPITYIGTSASLIRISHVNGY